MDIKKRTHYDPNEIVINGNIAKIVMYDLRCNEKARTVIDVEDIKKVVQYKWNACRFRGKDLYVKTLSSGSSVYLPNVILGIETNRKIHIDHINRNTLDNRKENLRACTPSQNLFNRGKNSNNKSGFKGVSWNKEKKKWIVRITKPGGRQAHVGYFNSKIEGAKAFNEAALKYHKEYACLNQL